MTICLTSSTIERITTRAVAEKVITVKGGYQQELDQLVERSGFKEILQEVVDKHKPVPKDIRMSVDTIYHEVSKHANGNCEPIRLKEGDYTAGEMVVLTSFFRL